VSCAGFAGVRSATIAIFLSLLWAGGPARAGDVAVDPALRTGVLPNGLKFVILKHAPAQHEVSLRLRIGAGSLQEPDDRNGVAHVLEHMAFRGSTHVPETEIWRTLARLGVAFGADSNAFTTTSQTYFQFDLPEADDAAVGTGLALMREIASELTLKPTAVADERNVVLAEARLTDSPSAQADRAQTAFWFADQPRVGRDAMGEVDVISQVGPEPLRAFYHAYYRPERATIIVVGDIDPAAIEAQIRTRFADWKGVGPAGDDPPPAVPRQGSERASVFVQPGAPSSLRLAWIIPKDATLDAQAAQRRRLMADLALRVLNRRLSGEAGAYLVAGAARQSHPPIGDVTLLSVDFPPGQWRAALSAVEQARRRLLIYGVEQGETDREALEALRARQVEADASEGQPTPEVANALVDRIDDGLPLSSAAQRLELAEEAFGHVSASEVNAALRGLFAGDGPLIFLSSPQPAGVDEAALSQAYSEAEAAPVAPIQRQLLAKTPAEPVWPYKSFGPPGVVSARQDIADLGVSFVRFQNGVRLTVRPSMLSGGQIHVQATIGGGRLDLPRDRVSADWAADSGVIDAGGLRTIDRADMRRALAASVYSFRFSTGDDGFNMSGVTRPADLDVQMQVLAAYASDPGWRLGAFERVQSLFTALLPQFEASPGGVLGDYVGGLLHDGDPRWSTPSMADLAKARARDLRAQLEAPLARGDIEVIMVGDVTVERAIQAVAITFGALPPRSPAPPPPAAYHTDFPAPTAAPVVRYHGGHADQALALIAWPAGDAYARSPGLADERVLQQVLNNRLIERLRIADGATYTPRTGLEASRAFPGYGYLYAAASVAPDKTALAFDRIRAIAADLRDNLVSDDELERGRMPALALLARASQTDAYWLNALSRAQADPRRLDLIRTAIPDVRAVTAESLRLAARTYLRDERAWRLVIAPHASEAR
jgi:zinc protease